MERTVEQTVTALAIALTSEGKYSSDLIENAKRYTQCTPLGEHEIYAIVDFINFVASRKGILLELTKDDLI